MKNIIVTGATKGIGKAIALKFAASGHNIAICARDQQQLDELKVQLEDSFQVKVIAFKCDVGIRKEVEDFASHVLGQWETVDVLINNAGIFFPGAIHEEEEGVFEKQLNVNLASAYYLSRMIIPEMKKQKKGHIFNMCSTASITAYTNGGSYCISKFALYGMTKVLREELKPHNIKVTAVLPGATYTASWEGSDLPRERFMLAEDVAKMVFAATQLSNGAVIEEILMRPQLGDI